MTLVRSTSLLALFLFTVQPVRPQGLAPERHLALRLEADSLYAAGERVEAAGLYAQIAGAHPADGQALSRASRGRLEAGDLDAGLALYGEAAALGWGDAVAERRIAAVLAGAGRRDEALDWIERALASGYEDRPDLAGDEAFAALADDPRFRRLAGLAPTDEPTREERWRRDLAHFLEEARRLHAAPSGIARSPEFAARVEELQARVGTLTDIAVANELQRIIASLGDGHSVLYPLSTETVEFPALPLQFWWFEEGLHVVGAPDEHADLIGARVEAIGGTPVAEVVRALDPVVSRDNPQSFRWIVAAVLRFTPYLVELGYADRPDRVILTVQDPGGAPRDVTVEAAPIHELRTKLPAPPGIDPLPRWLRRIEDGYWLDPIPEMDALYVQINQMRDIEDGESLEDFAQRARAALVESGAHELILDLRHNNGGDNFTIWPIVRLVGWHEMEGGRTWAIVSRNTFSAAQDLVNFLDRTTATHFVGEESGSKPIFVGEDTGVVLPYSGLMMSISARYWQDSYPGDERIWIPVEMPVSETAEAYFAGRDAVLEALGRFLSSP
ncbi:MAG TPA: hypothetical protein VFH82_02030 [Gemmatimonadota bacterium]|jgi:hypothetical protein|nr:hypothetical protein [Gemmatimonadota bacterium]